MGVRRGGGVRGAKNSMFLDFFEKKVSFLLLFRQKVGSCPPGNLEKSLWTLMFIIKTQDDKDVKKIQLIVMHGE